MHDINQVVKWYGMKIKVKKTKVMKIGRQPGQVITVDGQVLDQVEQFRHLGSLLSGDGYCVKEIKARIAMAKEALNKQKRLFTGGLRGELETPGEGPGLADEEGTGSGEDQVDGKG